MPQRSRVLSIVDDPWKLHKFGGRECNDLNNWRGMEWRGEVEAKAMEVGGRHTLQALVYRS